MIIVFIVLTTVWLIVHLIFSTFSVRMYALWRQGFFLFLFLFYITLCPQHVGQCLVLTKELINIFWMNEWVYRSHSGFCKLRGWEEDFGICIWVAFGAMFGQISLSKIQFLPLKNGDDHNIYIIRVLRKLNEVKCLAWHVGHGKPPGSDAGMVIFIMRNRDYSYFYKYLTYYLWIYSNKWNIAL